MKKLVQVLKYPNDMKAIVSVRMKMAMHTFKKIIISLTNI